MSLNKIGLVAGPLLLIIILSIPHPEIFKPEAWRVIAIAAMMIFWWVTEAVPLAVTAILPMVLLPLFGVSNPTAAAAPFSSPIVYLFFGGFMIALAMEKWDLHRRIALNIVRITGTNANGILLGFMIATAFLSMWISNTATTVMMLPIAVSVIDLLTKGKTEYSQQNIQRFALSMMLLIAYGANIGGTTTIIGTPPNVVFAGIMKTNHNIEVSFAQWIKLGAPFALALLGITYWLIVKVLYKNTLGDFTGGKALIRDELKSLGKPSTGETRTLIIFVATALFWIFRTQINALLPEGTSISDPEIAIPQQLPCLWFRSISPKMNSCFLEGYGKTALGYIVAVWRWSQFGRGHGKYRIDHLIADQFSGMSQAGFWIVLGLAAVSLFMTEVMSNVALVTILLPVVGGIAVGIGINPLYACIPVTLAASCAFMLPMSTPPNAIVFASGYITIPQMMRAGIVLNLITIVLIALLSQTIIPLIFP
ncbi:MAG: SLC13 family permease [Saprospiraceae bacterium]